MDTTGPEGSGEDDGDAGTFDNGATTGELRALARAHRITKDERYKEAFSRGFTHILEAQYPNGGWPQFYPLSSAYHRHITFNDGTMIRLTEFLTDAASGEDFAYLSGQERTSAEQAVNRGVDCIIECQIKVDGRLTAWCAQHDAQNLEPVLACKYEHPSISSAASAGILLFLMDRIDPNPALISAVNAGVAWFDSVKLTGYRYTRGSANQPLTADPDAAPLWARFYEIGTNRPIFSDRDGVVKYNLEEIGKERRSGYTCMETGVTGARGLI